MPILFCNNFFTISIIVFDDFEDFFRHRKYYDLMFYLSDSYDYDLASKFYMRVVEPSV